MELMSFHMLSCSLHKALQSPIRRRRQNQRQQVQRRYRKAQTLTLCWARISSYLNSEVKDYQQLEIHISSWEALFFNYRLDMHRHRIQPCKTKGFSNFSAQIPISLVRPISTMNPLKQLLRINSAPLQSARFNRAYLNSTRSSSSNKLRRRDRQSSLQIN